jgi:hypothetical protein
MRSINGYFGPLSRTQDPNLWGPLIKISLHSYPESVGSPTRPLQDVVALIDTGSQLCTLDGDIAVEFALRQGSGSSFLQLGREVKASSYFATLYIAELSYSYFAEMMASPFKKGDVPFQVILGWDFLRRFDLILTRRRNLVRLDWVGD